MIWFRKRGTRAIGLAAIVFACVVGTSSPARANQVGSFGLGGGPSSFSCGSPFAFFETVLLLAVFNTFFFFNTFSPFASSGTHVGSMGFGHGGNVGNTGVGGMANSCPAGNTGRGICFPF